MKKFYNILRSILVVFLVAVLIVFIYIFISINILKKDYVNFFSYTFFRITSSSMEDVLNIGDLIIVKLEKKLFINDIITYKNQNEIITHRIIEIDNKNIVTKGDKNKVKDESITYEEVIGKVVNTIKINSVIGSLILNPFVVISIMTFMVLLSFFTNYMIKKQL